jgi:hypothetical protein
MASIAATDGKLERSIPARGPRRPKHQLLYRKVLGVGDTHCPTAFQLNPKRSFDCQGEPLPGVECVSSAATPLDLAHGGPANAGQRRDLRLCLALIAAGPPEVTAQPSQLFKVAACRLARERGATALDHVRSMVAPSTYRTL